MARLIYSGEALPDLVISRGATGYLAIYRFDPALELSHQPFD